MKILVVDDDIELRGLIGFALRQAGYLVIEASDGPGALATFAREQPDLAILDVNLPGMNGFELCQRIRAESAAPIMMLTVRNSEEDQVHGLDNGADDYLTKPFSPRELVVRVKTILRRSRTLGPRQVQHAPERPALRFDDLVIDPDTREVWHDSSQIDLTPREFDLLYALAEQPGRVFNRDQLLERVWGHDFAGIDRVVDVHIGLLRRKLEDDPTNPAIIQTVRGVGYKFVGRRR